MKEEVTRILKMVQEGKISPEDAAELIDAFQGDATNEEPPVSETAPPPPGDGPDGVPPPPPAGDGPKVDFFKGFVDFMNNLDKEVRESVDWKQVADQARQGAQKGLDAVKRAAEEVKAGNINFPLFGVVESRDLTLPLNADGSKIIKIENPCGSVKVTSGHENGTVAARAKVRGSNAEEARAKAEEYTLIVEESEHAIIIRQPKIAALNVDLVLQLGHGAEVEVRTDAGDVSIADTGKGARVFSSAGDVSLRGLNGPIEVTMQSGDLSLEDIITPMASLENKAGDIELKRIDGNVNARAASGDIRADGLSGKTLSVESVSGDVNVEFKVPVTGSVNIRTVNGDTHLTLPDGCDCRVSVSTLRGDVHCTIPLTDEARSAQRITGRLGEGTGSIDISGINGDITLAPRVIAASTETVE